MGRYVLTHALPKEGEVNLETDVRISAVQPYDFPRGNFRADCSHAVVEAATNFTDNHRNSEISFWCQSLSSNCACVRPPVQVTALRAATGSFYAGNM